MEGLAQQNYASRCDPALIKVIALARVVRGAYRHTKEDNIKAQTFY